MGRSEGRGSRRDGLRLVAREERAATGIGASDIGAIVGGCIRQGRPLPAVLSTLCQLFDAAAKGHFSTVLLLDRTATRVRSAAGSALAVRHLKQLEGRRITWIGKAPVIACDTVPGLRLHEVAPIVSLTGEALAIFVVYQRAGVSALAHSHSPIIPQFTQLASAAIERMRGDEALKRSAALLERTQQLSATCCFTWCVETDEISWSKELCQLFEIDVPGEPLTLDLIGARMLAEDRASFHEVIERARSGVSVFEFEHRLRLSDRSIKYLHVVAHQTHDYEGKSEYIGAVQDVTHRRRTEEALANLRAELARAARVTSLGVLTAAIAHEVNQPLAGIVTNAGTCRRMLAVDPPDVEGARETARRTIRDAERAAEVVKRLRALFCKKGVTREALDLNDATREVMALSVSELERNKVSVRTELAGDLPPVRGDRVQLQQVIVNLLLNASDAMSGIEDRPRHLLIRTERDAEDGVRLSVRDTGVGVDAQGVERLFDAFYTTKVGGMGIGLSVSRSIIESHRGRLWASPNDGPGATFSFSIPCRLDAAAARGARGLGAIGTPQVRGL